MLLHMQKPSKVPVDSDWADNKDTCQSCSGGAVLFSRIRTAHVGTYTEDKSSFKRRGQTARYRVQSTTAFTNRLAERTGGVQTKRAWSNETHRVEYAHSSGMADNGTTPCPQSVDALQSGRLRDQGHDPRETDQVRTCSELATVNRHRLWPTCRVTTVTPLTATLTVLKTTVNSFQNYRLTANLGRTIETGSTMRRKNSPEPFAQNNDQTVNCQLNNTDMTSTMGGMVSSTASRQRMGARSTVTTL